jgi:hypothetical protein
MATERYRGNVISQIVDENGRMVTDHSEKKCPFLSGIQVKAGTSVDISMQFDLQLLIQPCSNLESLCLPFSKEEIDSVILDLPNDKAPGQDGFNSVFFRKAWPIIREDMYKLCRDFYTHQADIKSINYPTSLLYLKRIIQRMSRTLGLSPF